LTQSVGADYFFFLAAGFLAGFLAGFFAAVFLAITEVLLAREMRVW
jgi:hypothetical protein